MVSHSLKRNALHGVQMTPFRSNSKKQAWIVSLICLLLLVLDQAVKIWIKLSMSLGESISITNWFEILFVENQGMAYGVELGNKLFLTLFRIVAMGFFAWGLVSIIRRGIYKTGFTIAMALIFIGGIGNIIDSLFYGLIFSESEPFGAIAQFLPEGGGYAPLFYGRVVDMLYFPLIDTYLPSWIPFWGGEHFTFFDPVFNLADSYISIGVAILILFYFRSLSKAFEQLSNFFDQKFKKGESHKNKI